MRAPHIRSSRPAGRPGPGPARTCTAPRAASAPKMDCPCPTRPPQGAVAAVDSGTWRKRRPAQGRGRRTHGLTPPAHIPRPAFPPNGGPIAGPAAGCPTTGFRREISAAACPLLLGSCARREPRPGRPWSGSTLVPRVDLGPAADEPRCGHLEGQRAVVARIRALVARGLASGCKPAAAKPRFPLPSPDPGDIRDTGRNLLTQTRGPGPPKPAPAAAARIRRPRAPVATPASRRR